MNVTHFNGQSRRTSVMVYFVRHSDVTENRFEWKLDEKLYKLYKTPSPRPYFIVLASSVTTMEVKVIEFNTIVQYLTWGKNERVLYLTLWVEVFAQHWKKSTFPVYFIFEKKIETQATSLFLYILRAT